MRYFILCLCILSGIFADTLEQALEYEKAGKYKEAMQIYKKFALQNTQAKEYVLQTPAKTEKKQKENFARLALSNYLGEDTSFNPFGISTYKMNYFLPFAYSFNKLGENMQNLEMKFQFSVKKRLFEDLFGLDEKYYIAYTQTSWWQNYKHSSPFRETNYQPEFFVDFPLYLKDYRFFNNLRFGILHESNGKGDESLESRSWNRLYISTAILQDRFLVVPRIWMRIPEKKEDDDNPDIRHYLGNFDLNLAYLGDDYFINLMLRNNLKPNHNKGAVQVDLGYDIFNNGIYWYLQYFNGYGESLIDYDKSLQRLSTGFLISY